MMRRLILLSRATVVLSLGGALLVGLSLAAVPSAPGDEGLAPHHRDAGTPHAYGVDGGRCSEKMRKRLVVREGERVVHDLDIADAMRSLGAKTLTAGRHAGQPGLPLSNLVGPREANRSIEVVPCEGEPLALAGKDIWASPGRYILVTASRGALKLIDADADGKKPLRKNIAEVRVIPSR